MFPLLTFVYVLAQTKKLLKLKWCSSLEHWPAREISHVTTFENLQMLQSPQIRGKLCVESNFNKT